MIDSKGNLDQETFRWAQQEIVLGIGRESDHCAVIADSLFGEQRLREFRDGLVCIGKRPFIILLHCDEQTGQSRVKDRHSENPDAPIGSVLNGMQNDPSSAIWDAVLDSDQPPDDLTAKTLDLLQKRHWN